MTYPKGAVLKTPELERKIKELRTSKLNHRNRSLINFLEKWLEKTNFLTAKQSATLDRIYELANYGKA